MFSYHQNKSMSPKAYATGWGLLESNDLDAISNIISTYVYSSIVWADGARRESNFVASDFCALDFESNEYSLAQALKDFSDCRHIIGLTRNHRKIKGDKPPCDRFRVLIPWSRRIVSLIDYLYNMQLVSEKYDCDKQATDGARFFYPCTETISIVDGNDLFSMDVNDAPDNFNKRPLTTDQYKANVAFLMDDYARRQKLPRDLEAFLTLGKLFMPGREMTCFIAAIRLFERGWDSMQIEKALTASPFDRAGFEHSELVHAIKGAYRDLKRRLTNGPGKDEAGAECSRFEGIR